MLKKILIGVGALLAVVGGCVVTFLITNNAWQKNFDELSTSYAQLQQRVDAIGPIVSCYTVRATVEPGTQLTEDMLVEQSIPSSFTNEDFCSKEDILGTPTDEEGRTQVGYFAKTYIQPGTPITKSLVMVEDIPDSARELDITGNRWPIGMKVGDYVDIRITYAMGEDFIVLPHKRVYEINEQTLKVHMTEEEIHIYQAALVDWYLTSEVGTDLYFTKYIEPGVQESATPYYSIPQNIETVCLADPNIVDRAMVQFKENIHSLQVAARDYPYNNEQLRENHHDATGQLIAAGRDELNSRVNSDFEDWYKEYLELKAKEEAEQGGEGGEGESLIQ